MTGVVRGCGTRSPGGIYLVSEVGEKGRPIEYFLVDPPRPVDAEALGLSARGVALADLGGAPCVLDWVGQDSYPNVSDFLEETARFGSSRRVQPGFDFSALTEGSRHLFVHPRAVIDNPGEYWGYGPAAHAYHYPPDGVPGRALFARCLTRREDHDTADFEGMCATLWWHDLHPDTVVYSSDEDMFERQVAWRAVVRRQMPSFAYAGYSRPQDTRPRYRPGAFLWLPVHRVVVIADPEGGTHEDALKKAGRAGLPVEIEEE